MRQYVDSVTGDIHYTEEVLRRSDEIVKVFRPVGRSTKFVKIKSSQKAKRRLRKPSLAEAGFLLKIAPVCKRGNKRLMRKGWRCCRLWMIRAHLVKNCRKNKTKRQNAE
ncbi:hypothetical protein [Brevibacillus sp. BC25]|uniref:hypothetical protein n=1 Tax=Brevibacillus sp. BC25 TaxID=1144308 RepID=UPI001EE68AA5|nr:hypothetical protein [Brevibacillus sp. BC25]